MAKKVMSKETILRFPDFNKTFHIHTDASHTQLGAVIFQDNKSIAFYSRKLNPAQTRYTTTERELLSIVETLKEYKNILMGQQIIVYTDHKNLTYKNFNTERVLRWRLVLEEFGPTLEYLPGSKNIVEDALSRLEMTEEQFPELYNLDDDDLSTIENPLTYKVLVKAQQNDKTLLNLASTNPSFRLLSFRGGGKDNKLICQNEKIVVPKILQTKVVDWYHDMLCHPGETRMEESIRHHLTWKGLREDVRKKCRTCHSCQVVKRTKSNYGKLPAKEAESIPWDILCVDLIGPYTIKKRHKKYTLWCVTMIDPATAWLEIKEIKLKTAEKVANVVEQTWLTRYPWPTQLIFDRGTEFMGEFARMARDDYGLKKKPITTRHPQANAMIERAHDTNVHNQ